MNLILTPFSTIIFISSACVLIFWQILLNSLLYNIFGYFLQYLSFVVSCSALFLSSSAVNYNQSPVDGGYPVGTIAFYSCESELVDSSGSGSGSPSVSSGSEFRLESSGSGYVTISSGSGSRFGSSGSGSISSASESRFDSSGSRYEANSSGSGSGYDASGYESTFDSSKQGYNSSVCQSSGRWTQIPSCSKGIKNKL